MKLNKLNDWLQVIANLGIVIGIVLVLVQMNQNEDLLRANILNQYHDSYTSYEASFAGENLPAIWEKSLLEPENLSLAEMRALEAVTFVPLLRWINLYRQSKAGILGDLDWKEEVQMDATWYFDNTYARAWWENFANQMHDSGYLPDEVFELVEKGLNDPESIGTIDQYEGIQKIIQRNKEE